MTTTTMTPSEVMAEFKKAASLIIFVPQADSLKKYLMIVCKKNGFKSFPESTAFVYDQYLTAKEKHYGPKTLAAHLNAEMTKAFKS